jgi:hypothetical protein
LKLTPKQKEQLRRPRPFLFLLIISVISLPWLLLLKSGVQSRQQQADMIARSGAFFAQFATHPRNSSAEQFDRLAANLGFVPNDPLSLISPVNSDAERAYYQIERPLNRFLQTQVTKVSGPLDPLPRELKDYLKAAKPELDALQTYLLAHEAPMWEMDAERMSEQNYPFPGLVNTLNTQKLLLLSAIDYHQRNQPREMALALEASWQLNQAISERPDLVSQMSASVVAEYQAGILRHLNGVPPQWSARLGRQAEQLSVIEGIEFDVWLQYKSLQKALALVVTPSKRATAASQSSSAKVVEAFSYWFSPVYAFDLANIDTAQTAHRALGRLNELNVCSTSQAMAEAILSEEKATQWNEAIAPVPSVLAARWKIMGDRALASELTQQILQAKQAQPTQQATQQSDPKWPESLPNTVSSSTCPQENWIYQRENDSTLTISFSKTLTPAPVVPLRYQFFKK